MPVLIVVLMLAQADSSKAATKAVKPKAEVASPKCINVGGQRICGYNCLETASGGDCAETPDGICERGEDSQFRCFDPPLFLKRIYGDDLPKPKCIAHGMNMACGYNCAKDGDGVACAQTPAGACVAAYQNALCADPPVEVYGVYGVNAPKASCVARGGALACGYNCTVGGNNAIDCSETPFGACAEKGGSVTCFDPDKYVICAKGKSTPKPDCVYASGTYTCGYDCKINYGIAGCAKTPNGTCNTDGYGKPVCFDPPVRGGDEQCVELIGFK